MRSNEIKDLIVTLSIERKYMWDDVFFGLMPPTYHTSGRIDCSPDNSPLLSLAFDTTANVKVPIGKLQEEWLSILSGDRDRTNLVLNGTFQSTSIIWPRLAWDLALMANYVVLVVLSIKLALHVRSRRRSDRSLCPVCGTLVA